MSEYPSDWSRTTFGQVLDQRKEAGFKNEELLAVTSSLGIVKRDSLERRDTSKQDKSNRSADAMSSDITPHRISTHVVPH